MSKSCVLCLERPQAGKSEKSILRQEMGGHGAAQETPRVGAMEGRTVSNVKYCENPGSSGNWV